MCRVAIAVKDFHELRVYHLAFEAAMEIYAVWKNWPHDKRYDHICGQLVTMINQRDKWCGS